VNSSNVIKWNSEPEKCYPTKRTIGSLPSYTKLNDIIEVHQIKDFLYKLSTAIIMLRYLIFPQKSSTIIV
jgi:hypothetical protein